MYYNIVLPNYSGGVSFSGTRFSARERKKLANHNVHVGPAFPNDMIALMWFVRRSCITEVFGSASPPTLSFGFHVSIFILEGFNLNKDGLLVHCGNFTSAMWLYFWHGIIFYVCLHYSDLGLWLPVQTPGKCGWEKWMSSSEHPAATGKLLGWYWAVLCMDVRLEKEQELNLLETTTSAPCLYYFSIKNL